MIIRLILSLPFRAARAALWWCYCRTNRAVRWLVPPAPLAPASGSDPLDAWRAERERDHQLAVETIAEIRRITALQSGAGGWASTFALHGDHSPTPPRDGAPN